MAHLTRPGGLLDPTGFPLKVVVFIVFVALGSTRILTQHAAKEMHYNFLCPIIVIALCKLTCSVILYRWYDGASLSDMPSKLWEMRNMVLRYSAVSFCYATYDLLSFVNLAHFDPQSYMIMLQLRTGTTAVIWEFAFQKQLSWTQRVGIALASIACVMKVSQGSFSFGVGSLLDYLLIGTQILANCSASVANELLLKNTGEVPLNLQNAVQYTWSITLCLLVGVLSPIEGLSLNPLDMGEWAKMADVRMLANIVPFTLLGLVTSLMLKFLNAVWRSIGTTVELFATSYGAALIFGYAVSFADLASLLVVVAGIAMYTYGATLEPVLPIAVKSEKEWLLSKP